MIQIHTPTVFVFELEYAPSGSGFAEAVAKTL